MDDSTRARLIDLARLFTRLGFTAFGGPAAHVGLMENEIVTRRGWIDREHFLDLVSAVNFIPGPNSTELAIHIGQIRAGLRGLIVAGVCFITPAMLIILPLAWAYVQWGAMPQMQPALRGIAAAVAGIVIFATFRFAHTAIKDRFTGAIGVLTLIGAIAMPRITSMQPEIPLLMLAAAAGIIRQQARGKESTLFAIALPIGFGAELLRMAGVLLKIGATLFGSGYVLVSYLQSDFVDHRSWLTSQQLSDAIAVGNFTPGPLLTTATFVGYVLGHTKFSGGVAGGVIGGLVATVAIFLPAFVLVAVFGPMLQNLRKNALVRSALNAMNPAVVALMVIAAGRLSILACRTAETQQIDWIGVMLLMLTIGALWKNINATWLIILAGGVGAAAHAIIS